MMMVHFLIGDIFSKYIEAVPLRDQSASTAVDALLDYWIIYHGNPFYLLSDQGSNIDGLVIDEICLKFGIEKRWSFAYHSQGNGFAERNIHSVREILRSVLLDKNIAQKNWRQLLPGVVFALNTSESKAVKCIPYNVVFGRPPVLLQDVLLGVSEKFQPCNATTAAQYAADINFATKDEKIVHHDRLTPVKENKILNRPRCNENLEQNDNDLSSDLVPQENIQVQDVNLSDSSKSEEFEGHGSDPESELKEIELENEPQRYPQRACRQRVTEGAILWEAVDFVL